MTSFEGGSSGSGKARCGVLRTSGGDLQTPAFFPVVDFTGGASRRAGGIWDRVRDLLTGDSGLQGSMFSPMSFTEAQTVTEKIDQSKQSSKPLFVDSGGFKSLDSEPVETSVGGEKVAAGQSVYTDQESVLDLQLEYGADIIATLDFPITSSLNDGGTAQRMEDSIDSAVRCLEQLEGVTNPPAVYTSVHGHNFESVNWYIRTFLDLVENVGVSFEGFAIGSITSLQEDVETLVDIVQGAKDAISKNRDQNTALHLFGMNGKFIALFALLGVDSFDSSEYIQAAQSKEFINRELSNGETNTEQSQESQWGGDWSRLPADRLPDGWECQCPACENLREIGFETMRSTLYGSTSTGQRGSFVWTDVHALIGYHNYCAYQGEIDHVRTLIERGDDSLLEYVLEMAKSSAQGVQRGLRFAAVKDEYIGTRLEERGIQPMSAEQSTTE